jgi:hypothetical protein
MLPGIINAFSNIQSLVQHNREVNISNMIHEQQYNQNTKYNMKHLNQNRRFHNLQYNHNLLSAERECFRDIWAQKNHKTQTLIIMQTLIFGCCFGLIIEGLLPSNINNIIPILYSITLSVSIISIFISLICLLKLQSRMTCFNIFDRNYVYNDGSIYLTFDDYYNNNCRNLKKISIKFYTIGTINLIISGIILWSTRFYYLYNSIFGAIIFIIINSIGICTFLFMRYQKRSSVHNRRNQYNNNISDESSSDESYDAYNNNNV